MSKTEIVLIIWNILLTLGFLFNFMALKVLHEFIKEFIKEYYPKIYKYTYGEE